MSQEEYDISRFGVAIIESLGDDECQTGSKLYYDVLRTRCAADETMFADLYQVATIREYVLAVRTILSKLQPNDALALHVEAHGSKEGVMLSSGEVLPWEQFLSLCRDINIKLNGLLIATTAMCRSFSILAHMDPFKRSPFLAIIVSLRDVSPDELMRGYSEYYTRFRSFVDVEAAKEAMRREVNLGNDETSPFEIITQYWYFEKITHPESDPELFHHLLHVRYCQLKSEDPSYTLERTEQELRQFYNSLEEKQKKYFLFEDFWGT